MMNAPSASDWVVATAAGEPEALNVTVAPGISEPVGIMDRAADGEVTVVCAFLINAIKKKR